MSLVNRGAGKGSLAVAPKFGLPLDTVTQTFAILAMTGAGKSNTAVVLAEEMYHQGLPWVAVDPKGDWWGIRASEDGKGPGLSVIVFGGEHADVPLEPTSGTMVADFVVDLRGFVILDVSEMTKADQRRFLTAFAGQLYKRNREPLHLFLEEADEYIPQRFPQGEMAKLVGAMETLVKRGRFRGVGVTMISQRSASLNKDVLTQAGTLIAMRVTGPTDRKAVLAWIDYHSTSKEIVQELPSLGNGEAWVCSPHFLDVIEKVRFRQRRTFDSGATPRVGMKRTNPTNMAEVDLDAVRTAMAETIERAERNDPTELRKQLFLLEKQTESMAAGLVARDRTISDLEFANSEIARAAAETVQTSVLTDDDVKMLSKLYDKMSEDALVWAEVVQQLTELYDRMSEVRIPGNTVWRGPSSGVWHGQSDPAVAPMTGRPATTPRPAATPRTVVSTDDNPSLGKGERAILAMAAQYPNGVTREQLTINTGYKRSSRDAYIQRLRQAGLVALNGTNIMATQPGMEALGNDFEPLPTGRELREYWLTKLPAGESAILGILLDAYPSGVNRDEITQATDYRRSSRDAYLQRLRQRKLITTDGDPRAVDALFERG